MSRKELRPFGMPMSRDVSNINFDHRLKTADIPESLRQRIAMMSDDALTGAIELSRHNCYPFITGWGGARVPDDHPEFAITRELGRKVGLAGFNGMQGAGPGHMKAFALGIKDAGKLSIHNNIICDGLYESNYSDVFDVKLDHVTILSRLLLFYEAEGFLVRPGGIGTHDEDTSVRASTQLKIMRGKPIVMVGSWFFLPFRDYLENHLYKHGFIGEADLKGLVITDDLDEAVEIMVRAYKAKLAARQSAPQAPVAA